MPFSFPASEHLSTFDNNIHPFHPGLPSAPRGNQGLISRELLLRHCASRHQGAEEWPLQMANQAQRRTREIFLDVIAMRRIVREVFGRRVGISAHPVEG